MSEIYKPSLVRLLLRLGSIARIYFDANGGRATMDETSVSTEYDMGTEYRANGWKYPLYDGTTGHGALLKTLTGFASR